jgi:hypothetical protein
MNTAITTDMNTAVTIDMNTAINTTQPGKQLWICSTHQHMHRNPLNQRRSLQGRRLRKFCVRPLSPTKFQHTMFH